MQNRKIFGIYIFDSNHYKINLLRSMNNSTSLHFKEVLTLKDNSLTFEKVKIYLEEEVKKYAQKNSK